MEWPIIASSLLCSSGWMVYESSKFLQWRLPSFLQIPFYAETAIKHFLLLGQCVLGTEVDIPPTLSHLQLSLLLSSFHCGGSVNAMTPWLTESVLAYKSVLPGKHASPSLRNLKEHGTRIFTVWMNRIHLFIVHINVSFLLLPPSLSLLLYLAHRECPEVRALNLQQQFFQMN